ncbi:MAG: O-antigen export system permease protein RfbD, partial [uncultured Blastococcus sp.]
GCLRVLERILGRSAGGPRLRLAVPRAVGAPGLAGHPPALPAVRAGSHLDHHQHGGHGHRARHPLRRPLRQSVGRAAPLHPGRLHRLGLHLRLHPRGHRRLHQERGADQAPPGPDLGARVPAGVAADAAVRPQPHRLRRDAGHLPAAAGLVEPDGLPGLPPARRQRRLDRAALRNGEQPVPGSQPDHRQRRAADVLPHTHRVDLRGLPQQPEPADRRARADRRDQPRPALHRDHPAADARPELRVAPLGRRPGHHGSRLGGDHVGDAPLPHARPLLGL